MRKMLEPRVFRMISNILVFPRCFLEVLPDSGDKNGRLRACPAPTRPLGLCSLQDCNSRYFSVFHVNHRFQGLIAFQHCCVAYRWFRFESLGSLPSYFVREPRCQPADYGAAEPCDEKSSIAKYVRSTDLEWIYDCWFVVQCPFFTVDWVADPVQSGFLPTPLCLNVLTRFDFGSILHLKKK